MKRAHNIPIWWNEDHEQRTQSLIAEIKEAFQGVPAPSSLVCSYDPQISFEGWVDVRDEDADDLELIYSVFSLSADQFLYFAPMLMRIMLDTDVEAESDSFLFKLSNADRWPSCVAEFSESQLWITRKYLELMAERDHVNAHKALNGAWSEGLPTIPNAAPEYEPIDPDEYLRATEHMELPKRFTGADDELAWPANWEDN